MRLLNHAVPPQAVHAERLKAVVLDWAGTTVDYGSLASVRTLHELFARVDISIDELEIRCDMGIPKKEHTRKILSVPRVSDSRQKLHGHLPSRAENLLPLTRERDWRRAHPPDEHWL